MDVRFNDGETFHAELTTSEKMEVTQIQDVIIPVQFSEAEVFRAQYAGDETFAAEFRELQADPYTGSYTITPKLFDQILKTEGKRMLDDVTVKEIPVYAAANPHGGITVTIGGE